VTSSLHPVLFVHFVPLKLCFTQTLFRSNIASLKLCYAQTLLCSNFALLNYALAYGRNVLKHILISDGTHVHVYPKMAQKLAYINRKGVTSINVMIVAGSGGRIFYITTNSPGSYHDSAVFKSSQLWYIMTNGEFIPFRGAVMLADSAYETFHPWMCTPFSDLTRDPEERRFNLTFCRARVSVEQTIGRLKSKFRCLMNGGLRFKSLKVCAKCIQVCAALHNFILEYEDSNEDNPDESVNNEVCPSDDECEMPITSSPVRRTIIPTCQNIKNMYFPS
jgi:hypothetical protein